MKKISFLIPNYNTLEYTKWCYNSIRKNLSNDHEVVFINDGCTDGTNEWVESLTDKNIKYKHNSENIGIAYSYNLGVDLASNEIVCLLHSDMYIPKDFDKFMLEEKEKFDFVTAFRIEPPLYPPSPDKELKDFGCYLDEFQENKFNSYIENEFPKETNLTRMCFPWLTTKEVYNSINGIDELFLKYMVDDDDFYLRIAKSTYSYTQTHKTAVYHLCSRSTKFEKDNIKSDGSVKWKQQYMKSTRNFIRKWGFPQNFAYNSDNSMNVNRNKYDVGLICEYDLGGKIMEIEPFFDNIYTDVNYNWYIENEQMQTLINLHSKFVTINSEIQNDIIIEITNSMIVEKDIIKNTILLLRQGIEKHLINRTYSGFKVIINNEPNPIINTINKNRIR